VVGEQPAQPRQVVGAPEQRRERPGDDVGQRRRPGGFRPGRRVSVRRRRPPPIAQQAGQGGERPGVLAEVGRRRDRERSADRRDRLALDVAAQEDRVAAGAEGGAARPHRAERRDRLDERPPQRLAGALALAAIGDGGRERVRLERGRVVQPGEGVVHAAGEQRARIVRGRPRAGRRTAHGRDSRGWSPR
jgi:hypothetical protein